MTDVHYLQLVIKVWQLFSKDSIQIQRLHTGQRLIPLYLHPKFKKFFDERAGECTDGLYPTVSIRQIMWALKMKPIQRQRWETCFDRRNI